MQSSKIETSILKDISILYVEDDSSTQDIIAEILRDFCDNVKLASNGKEALNIFNKHQVDLIITDIEMPSLNGLELLSLLRKDEIGVPVVIFSAYTKTDYLLSSIHLDVLDYVTKPVSYMKIKNALYKAAKTINAHQNIYFKILNNLYYDRKNGYIIENGENIKLQKKERLLMNLLIENRGNLVNYATIEKVLWSDLDDVMTATALRSVVKKLRQKTTTAFIDNLSGCGYKLIM